MCKISIVIPVYNVERYLNECLDSVCNQTLQDIEIICVDDGSIDCSSQMLDQRALEDNRIKVIHKENGGYGRAMNIGMQMASGEYIGIVEPDDYIELDMMECLYAKAKENDVDFIKSDFWTFSGDGDERERKYNRLVSFDVYERVLKPLENIDIFWGYVGNWTGLYRKDFLQKNGIKHNETPGASYQDQGFWFQTHIAAERVYIMQKAFYNYRQDNPNASMLSKKKVFCIADEYRFIYALMKQRATLFQKVLPIYIKCKYACYLYNFERIEESSKAVFGEYFANEFRNHELQAELSLEYFSVQECRKLKAIIASPGKCEETLKDVWGEFNSILADKKIWIYGAGEIAEKTWSALSDKNKVNVQSVVVTTLSDKQKEFHEIPIVAFGDVEMLKGDNTVGVIATSRRYADEIIPMLEQRGLHNYIIAKEYV